MEKTGNRGKRNKRERMVEKGIRRDGKIMKKIVREKKENGKETKTKDIK